MKLIAVIEDDEIIEKILRHLGIWEERSNGLSPPKTPVQLECTYEPFHDDMPHGKDAFAA